MGDVVGTAVGTAVGTRVGKAVGTTEGAQVGAVVGESKQAADPKVEVRPAGQLKHCDAPMNIVCVDVNRVFTSTAESTLLYMRKSLMAPFK